MPEYVACRLGDRENFIQGHGFVESEIKPGWWNQSLKDEGLGQFAVSADPNGSGSAKLTRGELFKLANTLETDTAGEHDYLKFLWHVLAWGSGTSRRNNLGRVRAFAATEDRCRNVDLLRKAADHARSSASAAYSCLIRRGGGKIEALGPAFFTKFLYFVGGGDPGHPCLILDARVAERLFVAGWDTLPRHRVRNPEGRETWSYSANWYTATYVSYCDLLKRWAEGASARLGHAIAPDEIERALFEGP
jgi:hypothetical protein